MTVFDTPGVPGTAPNDGHRQVAARAGRGPTVRRAVPLAALALLVAACGSGTGSAPSGADASTAPVTLSTTSASGGGAPAAPPDAGGQPPGGGSATAQHTPTGVYALAGGSDTKADSAIAAADAGQSAVLASDAATLTLTNVAVEKAGDTQSLDESSFYGLNAGILAQSGARVTISGGTVSTTGTGANGIFAYGTGSSVTMSNATITATAQGGHGAMASGGGSISLTEVDVDTAGANSAAVATDRGGGTIEVTGGTLVTSGADSPGIYSTGAISATGATFAASGSEAAVIEGSNSITLADTVLSGAKKWGVMIYQSMSGDAQGADGTFTMTGGSLSASVGPLFYVTNATGVITLSRVGLTASSGTLLDASAGSWGTAGANGGTAILSADGQELVGDITADAISSVALTLTNGSTLAGAVDAAGTAASASLALDATSSWVVTADSHLGALIGAVADGTTITNIVGDGNDVTYDAADAANGYLSGGTYSLVNGGQLLPG